MCHTVGKHRFYYYLGVAGPTGQEMSGTEKILVLTDPKTRGHATALPHGEAPGAVRLRDQGKSSGSNSAYCGLHRKELGKQSQDCLVCIISAGSEA